MESRTRPWALGLGTHFGIRRKRVALPTDTVFAFVSKNIEIHDSLGALHRFRWFPQLAVSRWNQFCQIQPLYMLYVSDSVLQIRSHYCSAMSATSSSDEGEKKLYLTQRLQKNIFTIFVGSDAYNLQDFEEISDENASDCSSGSENEFLSPPTGSIQGYAFDPQYTPAEMLEIDAQTNESAMESDEIEKSCSCESCPDEPISGKCCKENWPPNIRPSECLAKTEEFKTVISRAHIYVLHFEVNAGRMQDSERDPQNKWVLRSTTHAIIFPITSISHQSS